MKSPAGGPGTLPHLPISVPNSGDFHQFGARQSRFVPLLRVAPVVGRLQIRPVLRRGAGGRISELPPFGNRLDFVHNEAQRVLGVGRLVVMDRPEPPVADAALAAHSAQPGSVGAPQRPVGIPWV